ncbi:MAG: hypothetical protein AAFY60_12045, partial [Myxococcota bacterium]
PRLDGDDVMQVAVPTLRNEYTVPRAASDDVAQLAAAGTPDTRDPMQWVLARLGDVASGEISADAFIDELDARNVSSPSDQPVLSRVRTLIDSAEFRTGPLSDRKRSAIDESILVTAGALAARNQDGDQAVRAAFDAFSREHPPLAEMAAGQVEMLFSGDPFPGTVWDGLVRADVQDNAPYLRSYNPQMRAAAMELMREAAGHNDDAAGRFSSEAALSALQTVESSAGFEPPFFADAEDMPFVESAVRTILEDSTFAFDDFDPGARTLGDYADRIADYARSHPRGSEERADAVNAMRQLVSVVSDYGGQFSSVAEVPGEHGDPAYASVIREMREHFLPRGAQPPSLTLQEVPEALTLFQRVPSSRDARVLAAGGDGAAATRRELMTEVRDSLRPLVAASLGDSSLAESPDFVDPHARALALAPGASAGELAAVRDGASMDDEQLALLLENAALYNALPATERSRLVANSAGGAPDPQAPVVDPDALLLAAMNGELQNSPIGLALDPRLPGPALRDEVLSLRDALLRDEFYALTDLESDIAAYDGNLEALLSD